MFDLKKEFGKRLKVIRKSRNLTQEKLAELIDIYPRQLSKIETGEHFPSSKTLEKICYNLDVLPKDLFDFCENDKNECFGTNNNFLKLIDKFKKVSTDDNYTTFVECAIDSINSRKALNKLQNMIDGIKLGLK